MARVQFIRSKTKSQIENLLNSIDGAIYFASDSPEIYLGTGGRVKKYGSGLPNLTYNKIWRGNENNIAEEYDYNGGNSNNIDGGRADEIYQLDDVIDGGGADATFD